MLLSLVPLALAASSVAAPSPSPAGPPKGFLGFGGQGNCNCNQNLAIGNIAGLTPPSHSVSFIALGVGTQNYTCSAGGTYASAGAVASLFDVSCITSSPDFATLSSKAFGSWNKASASASPASALNSIQGINKSPIGDHYFTTSPSGNGTSPKWDMTSKAFKGNTNAFVIAAKQGSVPSPGGSTNVDWLYLTSVGGALADEIYRTETQGGQPPASCTAGQTTTVKYTSLYYLTGGSVKK
ncbi:hypothetical protein V5O48_002753 [Marasmius crinis-equi]|uniref:Malate dehydrogenase n=1 Tax=Marasmius crinis-equi TaxID=585013 RepID=A0ABR3FUR5_9AGAR